MILFVRILILLLLAAVPAAAAPSPPGFAICNKTDHAMAVAIGRLRGGAWTSEGWWRIEPGACQDILRGVLRARYYYVRAVHLGVDGAWEGNRLFCVARDNFTIKGRGNCAKRGYGQAGFFEVDTGKYPTWTMNLSD
ncbi:MAG: DUF1036 domain-containing protein [Alphaproteobacteria bacterium]|nr:DUF1036 domain-containing protein [Alphaproteobacteria bacterium]